MDVEPTSDRFEFTPEQLRVLQNQTGRALHISVEATNKVYLVIEEGVLPTLDESYIREGLAHASEQVALGLEGLWNPDDIKSAGRELLARRDRPS